MLSESIRAGIKAASQYHAGQQAYYRGEPIPEDEGAVTDEWLAGYAAASEHEASTDRAEDQL
jgi:hypothetical protein